MNREELAARLRWLARQWQTATPAMQQRIEAAFNRGYERGSKID